MLFSKAQAHKPNLAVPAVPARQRWRQSLHCERPLVAQVGLAEMKMAIEATGGMVVQTDTFHNPVFRDSLARIFARPGEAGHMGIASNATFEVRCRRRTRPSGGEATRRRPGSHHIH